MKEHSALVTPFGMSEFKKAGLALFLLGFSSFSLIYCVQPLLPEFTSSFHITASSSALALSMTTGFLAFSIMLSGAFSQVLGRKGLMFYSMSLAGILNIICAISPNWQILIFLRSIEGFVLGGVPAVAMAWIAEEIHPKDLSRMMGLYIAGTAFGGMMGRVGMGLLTEIFSWQVSMAVLGFICLFCALGFIKLLPDARNVTQRKIMNVSFHLNAWLGHLKNIHLVRLYSIGFLMTSVFVTLFNYVTFRFSTEPYSLSQTQISLIFLSYSFGMVSSSIAGTMADRVGRKQVLSLGFILMLIGVFLTLSASLFYIILGIGIVTTGFFISHSIASGNVGKLAHENKGHAASLYLLFYYLGSSIIGSMSGIVWQEQGWDGIVILNVFMIVLALVIIAFTQRVTMSE